METPQAKKEARELLMATAVPEKIRGPLERSIKILYYIGMVAVGATMIMLFVDMFIPKRLPQRQLIKPTQVPPGMLSTQNVFLYPESPMPVPAEQSRQKRGLRTMEDNLLVKFKYAYARKSGYESCWVCNKLNQRSHVIPTLAVPVNLTSNLTNQNTGAPHAITLTKSINMPNTTHSVQITDLAYLPLWCFKMNKTQAPPDPICRKSLFNITIDMSDTPEVLKNLRTMLKVVEEYNKAQGKGPESVSYTKQSLHGIFTHLATRSRYIMPGEGIHICCGTICRAWITSEIKVWCYLAWVVPLQRIQGDTPNLEAPHPRYSLNFAKRELFSAGDMAWSLFPTFTGWGIEMMKRLNKYVLLMDEIVNITSADIQLLNAELREIRKMQLYQKLAIEQIQAVLNVMCEMTMNYECCTFIKNATDDAPDYYEIIQNHQEKVSHLQAQARRIAEEGWNPFKGFGAFGAWFGSILNVISKVGSLIITAILILLVCVLTYKLSVCLWPICHRVLKPSTPAPPMKTPTYLPIELKSPAEYKALMI